MAMRAMASTGTERKIPGDTSDFPARENAEDHHQGMQFDARTRQVGLRT